MAMYFDRNLGGIVTPNANNPLSVMPADPLKRFVAPTATDARDLGAFKTAPTVKKSQFKCWTTEAKENLEIGERKEEITALKEKLKKTSSWEERKKIIDQIYDLERANMSWAEKAWADTKTTASMIGDAASSVASAAYNNAKDFVVGSWDKMTTLEFWTGEVVKEDGKANDQYEICRSRPYMECTACKLSKGKYDLGGIASRLLGDSKMNEAFKSALKAGDDTAASTAIWCPGKENSMAMQNFFDDPLSNALTIAGNASQIANTAISGNSKLFDQVANAALKGDMKGLCKGQFDSLTRSVVNSDSMIGDLTKTAKSLGVDPVNMVKANVPGGYLGSATMSSALDVKKLTGFNGLNTSSISSVVKSSPKALTQYGDKLQDTIKKGSAVAKVTGSTLTSKVESKLPADVINTDNITKKMLATQIGAKEAAKFK
jgi:hypothetical protein